MQTPDDLAHYQSPELTATLEAVFNGAHTKTDLTTATGLDACCLGLALLRLHVKGYLNMRVKNTTWHYQPTAKARRARAASPSSTHA